MATKLGTFPQLVSADLSANDSSPQFPVGAKSVSNDGREFRYCLVGAVATVPGKLYQASAEVTANQDVAIAAAAIGATAIVTTAVLTVTANQYAGGWVVISDDTGEGYQYKIKSHAAATAAVVTFNLEDPVKVALTTSTTIDLLASPFAGVVVNPTTATSAPVAAAVSVITAAYYGWLQTKGPAVLLADGAVTVGTNLAGSNAVAGAVEAHTGVQALVGIALTGVADTEYGSVQLNLS